jgi:plastocyanin
MKNSFWRLGFIAVAVLTATALLPMVVASGDRAASAEPREIRLVAKDMTFYLEGQSTPNPTLRVQAGESIRLVLRNETPGMSHDLAITPWQVQTRMLAQKGEEAAVSFRVPDRPGTAAYNCTPHAEMMRGSIIIE